jgi:4-hydroxy-tetrahydrodipicolinate synthase
MDIKQVKGTIPALITPFKKDLSIDFDALKKIIDFQIDSGVEAILVGGSTGESATLNAKEKMSLIIQAVEYSAGRVPVIAGTGSNNTQQTIDMTLIAKEHGAAAALLVTPYYNKPSQEGLFQHFLAVSESVDLPLIIYNVPSRSGVNIEVDTQLKIAEEIPNVYATKEASGDLEQMMQIMKYAPKDFLLYCGDDSLALPAIMLGAAGIMSVIANYAPKRFGDAIRAALNGNFKKAVKTQYELLDLMAYNFVETNPVPVKTIMAMLGYCEENFRLPLVPILPHNKELIAKALKDAGMVG